MKYFPFAISIVFLSGCGAIASIGTGTGAMPVQKRTEYQSPQQVIYRVDKDRYITLENYKDCEVGGIMKWHDDTINLHAEITRYKNRGRGFWPGKFSIEPGKERIAIPTFACGEKWCSLNLAFTNDGGKTWDTFWGERYSSDAYKKDSYAWPRVLGTEVRVAADGMVYVIDSKQREFARYRLDGTKDQNPNPTGLTEEYCWPDEDIADVRQHTEHVENCERTRPRKPPFPTVKAGKYDMYNLGSVPNIKTPSGQERFTCDRSLNPAIKAEDD